jgi:hypothetical protein
MHIYFISKIFLELRNILCRVFHSVRREQYYSMIDAEVSCESETHDDYRQEAALPSGAASTGPTQAMLGWRRQRRIEHSSGPNCRI